MTGSGARTGVLGPRVMELTSTGTTMTTGQGLVLVLVLVGGVWEGGGEGGSERQCGVNISNNAVYSIGGG